MEFIEHGLKRSISEEEYEAINWFSYFVAGERNYHEKKILAAAAIVLDLLADKTEAKVYSNWVRGVAKGADYDFHKMQSFCIEFLTKGSGS